MEILITSFSLLTLAVIVILIGTRGRPMRFLPPSARRWPTPGRTGAPWSWDRPA
jgi:hypothetical protein